MEQNLIDVFDAIHMDESCAKRIELAMHEKKQPCFPARSILRTAIAACLVLILMVIALNPTTARAAMEIADKIRNYFSRTPGTIILEEDYVYYNDGNMEIDSQLGQTTILSNTMFTPDWLKVMDGRVYFTGSAERTDIRYFEEHKELFDITGLFSAEEPFLATFERDGITHYIAVGGDFDPEVGIDSIGYCEWLRRTDKMDEGYANGDSHAGWIGGSSRIEYVVDPEKDGQLFQLWTAKAIVELDIPWNYTEATQQLEAAESTE